MTRDEWIGTHFSFECEQAVKLLNIKLDDFCGDDEDEKDLRRKSFLKRVVLALKEESEFDLTPEEIEDIFNCNREDFDEEE